MGIHETVLTLICVLWDGNMVRRPLTADGVVIVLPLNTSLAKYLRSVHFLWTWDCTLMKWKLHN